MRTSLCLLFTILILNLQAQECSYVEITSKKWLIKYCREEETLVDGLSFENNEIFSFPQLKIKVSDNAFFNVGLILPDSNKAPYYVIQLLFIDDATDNSVSLFKGVKYVQMKISANKNDAPFLNTYPFLAYRGAIKYNDIPLRATTYCFILPLSVFQNMLNSYKSSDAHQIIFELWYGKKQNAPDNHDQFSFLGKEITHLLNQINLVGYKRNN